MTQSNDRAESPRQGDDLHPKPAKVEKEIENVVAELEEIEIEEFGRQHRGQPAPRAKKYVIRIDKAKYSVNVPEMKGRDILLLAGKAPPEQYKLTQKFHGGPPRSINLDEVVDFRAPGVERFTTLKLDQTEG